MIRYLFLTICFFGFFSLHGQQNVTSPITRVQPNSENIYSIKKQFLEQVLHNPTDKNEGDADNDLARFNRWYNLVAPRCFPTGNLPRPDVILKEYEKAIQSNIGAKTTSGAAWSPLGPTNVPTNYYGIGRINSIVVDPLDTNTLYVGAACGGVWISHNCGATWTSNSDNFPALSVADIAVNPHHTDTIYAATGDGYGYEVDASYSIFWGGLYSAGVMKSTDGGSTWHTTGLSYLQSNRDNIQKILIHPNNPNILLAATRHGIYRTADAGVTWSVVDTGHAYTMAFRPMQPDTIYAVNGPNLKVSYNAGLTWSNLHSGIASGGRCSIAVSPASPNSIWIFNDAEAVMHSHDMGATFSSTYPATIITSTNGKYGRVLGVSPSDSNLVLALGLYMGISTNGSTTWSIWDSTSYYVHPDHHCLAFNPLHTNTIYDGNDGGIVVTRNGGLTWTNISNGLMISQIYRMSSSRQHPYIMLCGLQDNATFYFDGTNWVLSNGPYGDGMACAIYQHDENIQIASTQYGNFGISYDMGYTFNPIPTSPAMGAWTSPVVFNPNSADTIYFGLNEVYASYDGGASAMPLSGGGVFGASIPGDAGVISLAIAASNTQVLYAADFSHIMRTVDGGSSWTNVTGSLPSSSAGITRIAVDYYNPMIVYVTLSGYVTGCKVYRSTTGGSTWTNISYNLPDIPANCIASDFTTPGALFVGTDIGVYYTDSTTPGVWAAYGTGLPNVMIDDIEINYANFKIRTATYGRGVWENSLVHPFYPLDVKTESKSVVQLYPNPATDKWTVIFKDKNPGNYTIKLTDAAGHTLLTQLNAANIDASKLASGVYNIDIIVGEKHYSIKAVKN